MNQDIGAIVAEILAEQEASGEQPDPAPRRPARKRSVHVDPLLQAAMDEVSAQDAAAARRQAREAAPVPPAKRVEWAIAACARHGIPARNYSRLTGMTAEEIDADAADLASELGLA